jgi:hypothetical protein
MHMSDRAFDIVGAPVSREVSLRQGPGAGARVFSLAMLCGVASAIGYAAYTAYGAARDCYVAPAILSPDSDVVIASKLKLAEIADERARASAEREDVDAVVDADDLAIARLGGLQRKLEHAVRWTSEITSAKAGAGAATLRSLVQQKQVMEDMLADQRTLTQKAQADLASGVISRTDYAKEAQALDQMQIALLDNARARGDSQAALHEAELAQWAMRRPDDAPLTPELMAHEEQVIRLELEISHLASEKRSKVAERTALNDRVAKLDELAAQLRSRPIYQAAEKSLDVAFVPYSQIDGVESGGKVYACVWSLFFCKQVGTVAELVPGEVVLPDPWGTSARGQYAVLSLWSPEAARLKTLRVRVATPSPGTSVASSGAR